MPNQNNEQSIAQKIIEAHVESGVKLDIKVENLVNVSNEVIEAAVVAAFFVLNKLLTGEQKRKQVTIIFTDYIYDQDKPAKRCGEAFPDGETIVIAMQAPRMQRWIQILGSVGSILYLSVHEATHIAQIRRGDPIQSSEEIIAKYGYKAYEDYIHEVEAHLEAFDFFKGIRPYAKGSLKMGGKLYTVPDTSSYAIDLSKLSDFLK